MRLLNRSLSGSNLLRPFAAVALLGLLARGGFGAVDIRPASTSGDDGGALRFDIEFPALSSEPIQLAGQTWDQLTMEGASWVGLPGAPDLPALSQLIEIPDRSDVQLRVIEEVSQPLHGLQPMPCQERMHTDADLPEPWLEDASIYQADRTWPGRVFELDQPALARDRRVVKASFFPVQVNPLTGEGRVIQRLTVEVTFDGVNPVNAREHAIVDPTPVLEYDLYREIYNPRAPEAGALSEAVYPNPGRAPGHYLMFAKAAAQSVSAFQDYVDWKRQRGHKVTLVSENDIAFNAAAIRARIIEEYLSDDPVDFVVLVGDTEGTYSIPTDGTSYDHYYAKIAGNDIIGDVMVGRLSCDNSNQLIALVNKIRTYESTPYTEDDAWLHHAGFTVGSSACYLSMKQLSRSIAGELVEKRGYTDIDTFWCASSGHVVGLVNGGVSFYNYRGWIGMEGLDMNQLRALAQGPRTPVATIFTCSTGDFQSGDDYTEAFINAGDAATPGGAVACMGFATASTHTRYNNVVVGGYYNCLLEHDVPEVGACLFHGKYELYMNLPSGDQGQASNFANWANLMGDPGTVQWAGSLGVLDVDLPASVSPGEGGLMVEVNNADGPVGEAAVCVWQPRDGADDLQSVVLTDENGMAFVAYGALEAGTAYVTITHRRNEPVLHELTVAAAGTDATVAVNSIAGGGLAPGADDQGVTLTLDNTGTGALTGITAVFALDAAYGTLTTATLSPADLPAGQTVDLELLINPASDLADGDVVPLHVTLQTDQGDLPRWAGLSVAAPAPTPVSWTTPSGQLEPGETRTLRLTVSNLGSADATGLLVDLACTAPFYGQVASAPVSMGTLDVGEEGTADFEVQVSTEAVNGFLLPLELTWTTSDGAEGFSRITELVGTPSTTDPTGPDEYGYWAYESSDDTYVLHPEFSWIPITPSEGGSGVEVSLSDNGNEQDDATWIDLPFDFTYYGETYDRALVCSNGWISFAENGFAEYDFRNHHMPSGMGPDAMIAPMWDDHTVAGAAGVWTWYDSVEDRFVITWWNLPGYPSGGPNTFQLALYDPAVYPTVTGDGPFLYQYSDFNDTQSAGNDFDYCTVGIKDHTSTNGLTLLNAHERPGTMHPITDGTAIFWTTMVSTLLSPPDISIAETSLDYSAMQGYTVTDSLQVRNVGEMPLMWAAMIDDSPRDQGGPDGFGYVWMDNDEPNGPAFDWLESDDAVDVVFENHDALTPPIEPGFTMHLYGHPFDSFRISANGYIVFGSEDGDSNNLELPSDDAPGWMIAAWWDDLKPDDAIPGQVQWWTDGSSEIVVSWNNVSHFNPFLYGGPVSAQLRLRAGGEILLQVEDTGGGLYPVNTSGTVGIQGIPGTEGLTFFHNEDASERLPWAASIVPPAWVELHGTTSGTLAAGDSTWVHVFFTTMPGYPLEPSDYTGTLVVMSNDPEQQVIDIPFTLEVTLNAVDENGASPLRTALTRAWPNPFNPTTTLAFEVAQSGPVTVRVFNLLGQEVARLADGRVLAAGSYELGFDASQLASGLYVAVLEAAGHRDEMKLMLMK